MTKGKKSRSWIVRNELNDQQKLFVAELLGDLNFNGTEAARKVGYKNPNQDAYRLLKMKKVQKAIGKSLKKREQRCELTGDDVLNFIKRVLYFNPLEYFHPGEDGGWEITDISALPPEVGQLIDGMKIKVTTDKDGSSTSVFEVQLISKATALALAARHTIVEKQELKVMMDWSKLWDKPTEPNPIDTALLEAEK